MLYKLRVRLNGKIVVVVGEMRKVKEVFAKDDIEFVLQKEQKGTGHALMQAEKAVAGSSHFVVLEICQW